MTDNTILISNIESITLLKDIAREALISTMKSRKLQTNTRRFTTEGIGIRDLILNMIVLMVIIMEVVAVAENTQSLILPTIEIDLTWRHLTERIVGEAITFNTKENWK